MKVKVNVYRLDIQPLEGGPVGSKAPTGEQIWVERRENHGHLPGNLLSLCPGIAFVHWQCCFIWSALQINYLDESDVNGFQVRECILYSFTCVRVHFVYFTCGRMYSLHFFVCTVHDVWIISRSMWTTRRPSSAPLWPTPQPWPPRPTPATQVKLCHKSALPSLLQGGVTFLEHGDQVFVKNLDANR